MKFKSICWISVLALFVVPTASHQAVAQESGSSSAQSTPDAAAQSNPDAQTPSVPLDKLVIATCRQAWQLGGRTQEGFYAIVKQLAALSAQNRGVTLPDNKTAGARAGTWIRTQALKDPDQLLYAVVDQAVQHSIAAGRAKPTTAQNPTPAKE